MRGLCNRLGYESVALIPLYLGEERLGLVQLNDRRKGLFSPEDLNLWERLAGHLAVAVSKYLVEEALRESEHRERRRAEELNAAREAAEAANVAKSQFLANVSHELRTPMNAILGMTELALGEQLPASVREYLKTVQESAGVLLELLNELLDLARMEAGKFQFDSIPFSLRRTLEQTLKTLGMRAYEKGLELICDLPDDVPDALLGDPLRLRQVLTNLIGNAIKFTEHGEVVVGVEVEGSKEAKARKAESSQAAGQNGNGKPALATPVPRTAARGRGWSPCHLPTRGHAGFRHFPFCHFRHGDRHRGGRSEEDFCPVHAGRLLQHPQPGRHRVGIDDFVQPGQSDGRTDVDRKPIGRGKHLLLHRPPGAAAPAGRIGTGPRRAGKPPRPVGPDRHRESQNSPHFGANDRPVGHEAGRRRRCAHRLGQDS